MFGVKFFRRYAAPFGLAHYPRLTPWAAVLTPLRSLSNDSARPKSSKTFLSTPRAARTGVCAPHKNATKTCLLHVLC